MATLIETLHHLETGEKSNPPQLGMNSGYIWAAIFMKVYSVQVKMKRSFGQTALSAELGRPS